MIENLVSSFPIGIFDSGVGGLSVVKAIRSQLPNESILYLADQYHVPYGERSLEEVRRFSITITQFLLCQGAKLIVVACNTASAAALHFLRDTFSQVSFVGMEPAVKPAVEISSTRRVGVLATPATFQGALYASVVERFARDVIIYQNTCAGLVNQIEAGYLDTPETRRILEDALLPMLEKGIDAVVLGCTHYPYVIPLIKEIVGENIRVIDPAPAVAKQVERILSAENKMNKDGKSSYMKFFTTGSSTAFRGILPNFLAEDGIILPLKWVDEDQICVVE
jgi:glutamate racemase